MKYIKVLLLIGAVMFTFGGAMAQTSHKVMHHHYKHLWHHTRKWHHIRHK
jgi:hypothetical protein